MDARNLGLYFIDDPNSDAKVTRLQNGQFHVWLAGELGLLPRCELPFILAAPALADALAKLCGHDLVVRPVEIVQRVPAQSWSYRELVPSVILDVPRDLPAAVASTRRLWACGGYLVVREDVKRTLERPEFAELTFNPDLLLLAEHG